MKCRNAKAEMKCRKELQKYKSTAALAQKGDLSQ